MFGLQPAHLILIAIIALLIFGPAWFAGLGRAAVRSISEFRSASREESIAADAKPGHAGSKDRGN
ncbi:MAG: twin-arginine translocase TatA/TatE family subunit [Acidobacteriota bacterium]